MKSDPNLWNEFNFTAKSAYQEDVELEEKMSSASTAESSYCGSPVSGQVGARTSVKVANIMMIGSQQAGLYKLLDDSFQGEALVSSSSSAKRAFDLVIKEQQANDRQYKLKFWLHDPSAGKHETIISVYYKTIQYYMFVYRPEDRESFNLIVETIEKVKAKMANGKFTGLLVCDMTGLQSGKAAQVSEEEVEMIVQKYGLTREVHTSEPVCEVRQEVLKMLDRQSENKTAEFLLKKCLNKQEVI